MPSNVVMRSWELQKREKAAKTYPSRASDVKKPKDGRGKTAASSVIRREKKR
jgi:hypothetical protein